MARCDKTHIEAIADSIEARARAVSSLRRALRHLRRELRMFVRELGAWALLIAALFASALTQWAMHHWH